MIGYCGFNDPKDKELIEINPYKNDKNKETGREMI
jgi:hypothetical protein